MGKIIFQISYEVKPDSREDYLSSIKELEQHIRANSNRNYMVFEDKNNKNFFTEMYICENEEEYDSLEDNTDDKTFEITKKLFSDYIIGKKANYTTFYEI